MKVYKTTLERLDRIGSLISSHDFCELSDERRKRTINLHERMEEIVAEIWIKDRTDKITFDKYGYCKELWDDHFLLFNKKFFNL